MSTTAAVPVMKSITPLVGSKRPLSLAASISRDNNGGDTNALPTKRRKVSVDSAWDLGDLPELPYLYLKEKTSVVVMNEEPQTIATRILECAKILCASGQYNGAKARATLTVNNMEFCVQLFKVTEKTNECVIVELHRVNGSSITFHSVARSILNAAKAKSMKSKSIQVEERKSELVRRRVVVRDFRDGESSLKKTQDQEELFTCTLEMVDALLKKDRVDANLLGMESLELLTRLTSTSDAMVKFVTKIVLTAERFSDIKDTITSLIANYSIDGESVANADEDVYYQKMRVCALSVLSNSIDVMSKENPDTLDEMLRADDWVGDHGLLTLLLNELKKANKSPQEAYLAGSCLKKVFEKSCRMKNHAVEKLDAMSVFVESQKVGRCSHNLLESVSDSLLQIVGNAKL